MTKHKDRMLASIIEQAREQGRREERERAIAVLRPFAKMARLFDGPFGPRGGGGTPDHGAFQSGGAWQENGVSYTVTWGHFRAASDYITQAQGADQ